LPDLVQQKTCDCTTMRRSRWRPELGTPAYPPPLVDEKQALSLAKRHLCALHVTPQACEDARAIQDRHGSRKSRPPPTRRSKQRKASRVRERSAAVQPTGAE
jgi:hypothetical protein